MINNKSLRKWLVVSCMLGATSCANNLPVTLLPFKSETTTLDVIEPTLGDKQVNAEFLYNDSPEIRRAMKEYMTKGKAPTIRRSGFVQLPFEESDHILYCRPRRGCSIELQAGEIVTAIVLGDEERWEHEEFFTGAPSNPIPHVVVSPAVPGISTNLIIGTNRRTYYIGLVSKNNAYVRRAKFYYPREQMIAYKISEKKLAALANRRNQSSKREKRKSTNSQKLPHEYLNFKWKIKGDRNVSWYPRRIYDDGVHVYIEFDEKVKFTEFPGIFVDIGNKELSRPNWSPAKDKSNYIVVDGVFEKAYLLVGVGKKQKRLVLERQG